MDSDDEPKTAIRVNIPQRVLLVPGTAFIVGSAIGLVRGGRTASLRFLAENAHRPPKTVQGWYFYNKTKNYRVMLGGLKGAGLEGSRLGAIALCYVGLETAIGLRSLKEIGAGVGTGAVFSIVYRLPLNIARRSMVLGLITGCCLRGVEYIKSGST